MIKIMPQSDKKQPLASKDANALHLLARVACVDVQTTTKSTSSSTETLFSPSTSAIQHLAQERNNLLKRHDVSAKEHAKLAKPIRSLDHQLSAMTRRWQAAAQENAKLKNVIIEQERVAASWKLQVVQEKHRPELNAATMTMEGRTGTCRVNRRAALYIGSKTHLDSICDF